MRLLQAYASLLKDCRMLLSLASLVTMTDGYSQEEAGRMSIPTMTADGHPVVTWQHLATAILLLGADFTAAADGPHLWLTCCQLGSIESCMHVSTKSGRAKLFWWRHCFLWMPCVIVLLQLVIMCAGGLQSSPKHNCQFFS